MGKFTRIVSIGGNDCVVDKNDRFIRKVALWDGNSNRERPTYADGARDGDRLNERDTGNILVFDEDLMDWTTDGL